MSKVLWAVWFLFICSWLSNGLGDEQKSTCSAETPCSVTDENYAAIKQLHYAVDDDKSGDLDKAESDGFLRDELEYANGKDREQRFLESEDRITVDDLWSSWLTSEVYLWTPEEVQAWLVEEVELPQYLNAFKKHGIRGSSLPKLATDTQFVSNELGVKNSIAKHRLVTKAMDAVLFGPPKKIAKTFSSLVRSAKSDKQVAYDAIKQLHAAIDDDKSGHLDRAESDGFMRDELKYEDGFERQENFHGSDDLISVDELWTSWVRSEVFNWSAEEVEQWLEHSVELPQYLPVFRENKVNGSKLPKIATSSKFLNDILGIKNPIDKHKLSVKAMDVVLFGPQKKGHSYVKDLVLMVLLMLATSGCWLAYMQNRTSQQRLRKVMKDLENLQQAEEALLQLQSRFDKAQTDKMNVTEEKNSLETKFKNEIQAAKDEAMSLQKTRECTAEEIGRLKLAEQELEKLKRALEKAELQLQQRQQSVPLGELQQWLQLTYERESRYYQQRRVEAENKRLQAKEMCEKIRKRRNAFLGSLRVAHTTTIDTTDQVITNAKTALEDVRQELQERSQRWKQIERICGFMITVNPGLESLEARLRCSIASNHSCSNLSEFFKPLNVEDATEDFAPAALLPQGTCTAANNSSMANTSDHRVWPNLMKAGMQLTMLGINLTDKRLSGAIQPMSTFNRDLPRPQTMGNLSQMASFSPLVTPLSSPQDSNTNTISKAPSAKSKTAWRQSDSFKQSTESKTSSSMSIGSSVPGRAHGSDVWEDRHGNDADDEEDSDMGNVSMQSLPGNGANVVFGLGESQKQEDAPLLDSKTNADKQSLTKVKKTDEASEGTSVKTSSRRTSRTSTSKAALSTENGSSSEKEQQIEDWLNTSDKEKTKSSNEKINSKKKLNIKKLFKGKP